MYMIAPDQAIMHFKHFDPGYFPIIFGILPSAIINMVVFNKTSFYHKASDAGSAAIMNDIIPDDHAPGVSVRRLRTFIGLGSSVSKAK